MDHGVYREESQSGLAQEEMIIKPAEQEACQVHNLLSISRHHHAHSTYQVLETKKLVFFMSVGLTAEIEYG